MTKLQAIEYAVGAVSQILPLEENEVKDLCEQVLQGNSSNSESIAQRFLEILGQSDLAFEFVIRFNEILSQQDEPKIRNERIYQESTEPTERSPLKTATAPKPQVERSGALKEVASLKLSSTPLVEAKSGQNSNTKPKTSKKELIQEIDQVWKFLQLDHDEKNVTKFACNCQGNLHPLFEAAPNCLSCGKIICAREGLHLVRCSFCSTEFIPLEERLKIVQLLKREKEELMSESSTKKSAMQQQQSNRRNRYSKGLKISSGMGTNLFTEQDRLFDLVERQRERERKREEVLRNEEEEQRKEAEIRRREERERDLDPDLIEAQERLNKLLYFQDTSAERTKIIDNAADFSMSNDSGVWGTAQERALMLKKQQRNLRKWEKLEGERNGKRDKYVVSMDIGPNGKVTMKEVRRGKEKSTAESDDDIDGISDEDDLRDLRDIQKLKGEVESSKQEQNSNLQSKVWDYEKDRKQWEPPKYMPSSSIKKSVATPHDKGADRDRKHRVQMDQDNQSIWELIA
ncbi:hypothetical protein HG536_0F01340 [Torulaspora globosa]|uniref:TRIP4/RQT4 C2HC5-type zinc finger domain-containing protein n=1 Tax=Torulaspora globosa TaxID=48254 RepID=A0A7G3ZJX3_9SACH|nr:uncharacterized protein HG536_0F01340 [Torulaspora globosa]QLL33809.1 hypothetical protein HG536_0F01340 [Torulaspora globosa]